MPWVDVAPGWDETRQTIIDAHRVTAAEAHTLAIYDSERARGITHTPDWAARMAEIRERHERAAAEIQDRFRAMTATPARNADAA